MTNDSKQLDVQNKSMTNPEKAERTRNHRVFSPRTDIYETENEIVLVADMPGVDDQSIDITLEKNVLTIDGTVPEVKVENYNQVYSEYGVGDYVRSFVMPEQIDHDHIKATVQNGVLRLYLPKSTQARTHKITVKSI